MVFHAEIGAQCEEHQSKSEVNQTKIIVESEEIRETKETLTYIERKSNLL